MPHIIPGDNPTEPVVGAGRTKAAQRRPVREKLTDAQWDALDKQILDKTDIAAEYRAMGVVFARDTPTGKGWLACHAVGREDHTASAAVNVGPYPGRYRDMGGEGLSLSLWDFAAQYGKHADWKAARRYFAEKAGVALPGDPDRSWTKRPSRTPAAPQPAPAAPDSASVAGDKRFDDFDAVGWATAPPVPPVDAAGAPSDFEAENQALLDLAGLVVIGEYGGQEIEVYSIPRRKVVRYDSIDKITHLRLVQLCGDAAFNFCTGKAVDGKQPLSRLLGAIAAHAGRTDLSRTGTLGQGIWRAGGRIVLVNGGTAAACADGRLTPLGQPRIGNDILDFATTEPWVDFSALDAHLASAGDLRWCREVISDAVVLFGNWNWKHPRDAAVAALLAACSFAQTLWAWRPEVAITGPSDCGKSTLLSMMTALFGPLNLYVSKPTEAGLRQHLANSARVILVDEFESGHHRQKILDMCRTTSQGGTIIRGTSDQKGKAFRICHIPWFAAIESGLTQAADRNRFIILDLAAVPATRRGHLVLPGDADLRDLGLKLCAVTLRHVERVREMFRVLKGTTFDGVHGRLVENFSLPAALLAVVHEQNEDAARLTLGDLLSERAQLSRQGGADEKDLLNAILGSQYQIGGGVSASVSATLADRVAFVRHWEALETVGVGLTAEKMPAGRPPADWCDRWWAEGKLTHIFLDPDKVKRFLLKGTRWEWLDIEQLLLRVPGKRDRRTACNVRVWGIVIPKKETDLDDRG